MWSDALAVRWKLIDRHVCVFSASQGELTMIVPPLPLPEAADGDLRTCVDACFEIMDGHNDRTGDRSRSRIEYVSDEILERFRASSARQLSATPLWSDYVYETARLIDLSGGALKSKRHARSKFCREFPGHRTAPIRQEDVVSCMALLRRWACRGDQTHDGEVNDSHIGTDVLRHRDLHSTDRLLRHVHELNLPTLALWVGDNLVGFTIGEQLSPSQAVVLVEKCDSDYPGAAQFIFSEFCRQAWSHLPEVNVGDDWGIPSLRFTKQSYRPIRLLSKYILTRQPVVVAGGLNLGDVPMENRPHKVLASAPPPAAEPLVRPAALADVAAIMEIEGACFDTLEETFNKRQVKSLINNPRAPVSVAELDGKVVGWAVGLVRQHRRSRSGRLYAIAIHPSAQGRHIGRRLAEATIAQLNELGIERIFLEVRNNNEGAVRLYRKLGFVHHVDLPNYYGQGKHGMRMVLPRVPVQQVAETPGLFEPVPARG